MRVFLEGEDSPRVSGRLVGVDSSGHPLAGSPLAPFGSTLKTLSHDATFSRQILSNSFNFVLPTSWTEQPDLQLGFELTDAHPAQTMLCSEPDGAPDCSVQVSFAAPVVPVIDIVSAGYT